MAFGSDQGMCGQFNEQMAAFVVPLLEGLGPHAERTLVVAGSRLADRLDEAGHPPDALVAVPASPSGTSLAAQETLLAVDRARRQGAGGPVKLCHQRPRGGAGGSQPQQVALLPLPAERIAQLRAERWPSRSLPMPTPEPGRLFSALVQQVIFVGV